MGIVIVNILFSSLPMTFIKKRIYISENNPSIQEVIIATVLLYGFITPHLLAAKIRRLYCRFQDY